MVVVDEDLNLRIEMDKRESSVYDVRMFFFFSLSDAVFCDKRREKMLLERVLDAF